jgi:ComF family protein
MDIIYPDLCLACSQPLQKHERILCLRCQLELPKTDYAEFPENPVAKKFWGKVPVANAMALYHFHKSSRIQNLMHALKYKGRQDVGIKLGNLLGFQLFKNDLFNSVDYITSVPLHREKEIKRGYNQANLIGEGLSEILEIPFASSILRKTKFTDSQTKKNRIQRWENVKEIFQLEEENTIKGKHILLIDDVITTGSTLEACTAELIKADGVRVSIAAVAHAEM